MRPDRDRKSLVLLPFGSISSNAKSLYLTYINRDFVAAVRAGQYAGYPTNLSA